MSATRPTSVLLVVDSESRENSLKNCFNPAIHTFVTANSHLQALKYSSNSRFDIAVISLSLPTKNICRTITGLQKNISDIKIIIASVHPSVDEITKTTNLGAIGYMVKPFSAEEFGTVLKTSKKPELHKQSLKGELYPPSKEFSRKALISNPQSYKALYNWSIKDPEEYWGQLAEQLVWQKKWNNFSDSSFRKKKDFRFFTGGKINACYNCIDRHLETWRRNKAALIWQGERDDETRTFSYQQLHHDICRFANVLKKMGVQKGDAVTIYMPVIPELTVAMLACARIGAIHNVVFGGFSGEALSERILDCGSKIVITADGYHRNGHIIRCKDTIDEALVDCPDVRDVIVVKRLGLHIIMDEGRDRWWHDEISAGDISSECEIVETNANDPLFILYTSGSTDKPKGIIHTHGGYLLQAFQTMKWVFDIKDEDVFWCTADLGWVTGHSYVLYGPFSNGATSFLYEGSPTYPAQDRVWEIIEKYGINTFYTTPMLIRSLMREGAEWPHRHNLSSLRLLGTVGEPISPKAWLWFYETIGNNKCPVVDTWWQTETGGHLISAMPGAVPAKPGSASLPLPGIEPVVLRKDGTPASANESGYLCIKKPWPGIMLSIHNDENQVKDSYFAKFPGYYFTGDGARYDEDGYFWLTGRIDDVINISGHRISPMEIESALNAHHLVDEVAVVGIPHAIKGQGIYAFITLVDGVKPSKTIEKEFRNYTRKSIGPIAGLDKIQFTDALPKTRSGKIIRRILMGVASHSSDLGDTSVLHDKKLLDKLVKGRV